MNKDADTQHPQGALGDMPAEEFRKFGHQMVDWVADYLDTVEQRPVRSNISPGDLVRSLPALPPQQGEPMQQVLADVDRLIMPAVTHWNHPRFHAYFNSSSSSPGILGELLSAALNGNGMVWESCPAVSELEEVTLGWLRHMLGLPKEYWGMILDTASTSTMHAIAAARESLTDLKTREHGMSGRTDLPKLRVYLSDFAHSSIEKAVITLGFGMDGIRRIAVDDEFRMRPEALAEAITDDRRHGMRPFCVVATVGTTSCTSIDPIPAIADICERENLWLHVDAAYGGSAAIVPEKRYVLEGCDRADSFVVNPHKWMFVPVDLSVLYTRKPDILRRAFSLVPEYLRTAHDDVVHNLMDFGVPLGRRFRALKFWFVLRYFGWDGLAARLREHLRLAQEFKRWVEADPDFEVLAPVHFGAVCFRAHPKGMDTEQSLSKLNDDLINAVNGSRETFLSHTKLGDRYTIRMVIGHLKTQESHALRTWQQLQRELKTLIA
ncbi:MAG: pyridoxal-dependent decarboxylase [Ignavibacteriales bacterium]|nr:pyridoxal-dependent decarboxylase [Ignavibacteriales bacterium]